MRLLDTRLPEIKLAILRDENLDEYGKARYWDFIQREYAKALQGQKHGKDPLRPTPVKGKQNGQEGSSNVRSVQVAVTAQEAKCGGS